MKSRKGLECSFSSEKLEATLCVPDASHTEEPHQEVKAVHQECSKHRALLGEECQYLESGLLITVSLKPKTHLPVLLNLSPGEL